MDEGSLNSITQEGKKASFNCKSEEALAKPVENMLYLFPTALLVLWDFRLLTCVTDY